MRDGIVGAKGKGASQVHDSLGDAVRFHQGKAESAHGVRVVRHPAQHLPIGIRGASRVAGLRQQRCEIEMRVDVVRVAAYGGPVGLDGLRRALQCAQHVGEIVVADRVPGATAHRLLEQLARLLQPARRLGDEAEMQQRRRMGRVAGQNLTVQALRLRQAACLVVPDGLGERWIFGHQPPVSWRPGVSGWRGEGAVCPVHRSGARVPAAGPRCGGSIAALRLLFILTRLRKEPIGGA